MITESKYYPRILRKSHLDLDKSELKRARQYIADYWTKLERYHPKDEDTLIGLPRPYLVPSSDEQTIFDYNELYYWDSYFMIQGMLDKSHEDLVTGILEDLESLFNRFHIVPNASRTYLMGRSQPPFLTSFIFDIFGTYGKPEVWLEEKLEIAKEEYETVWLGKNKSNWRQVSHGLSRYYDINMLHALAEAESGWDMTTRFNHHALNYLPVDLNALLYKYEMDFVKLARMKDNLREAGHWEHVANLRKAAMNDLMWDNYRGIYFDYDYVKKKRSNVASLATFFPMWAGMIDELQAKALVKSLRKFENRGGLATTDSQLLSLRTLGSMPTQWAYPNGWAPLHFIVIEGLKRYGYQDDAKRIALKWVKCNLKWFSKNNCFLEKYNVVNPDKPPVKGVYPTQTGFGWTNAIFERFCRDFIDSNE